jgi:hypothetical protein
MPPLKRRHFYFEALKLERKVAVSHPLSAMLVYFTTFAGNFHLNSGQMEKILWRCSFCLSNCKRRIEKTLCLRWSVVSLAAP